MLLDVQTNQKTDNLTVLQRLAQSDKTAIQDCINKYGNLIWALVNTKTDSLEEAEKMTSEIFNDIWKYAERFDSNNCDETTFISAIAYRRFIIH